MILMMIRLMIPGWFKSRTRVGSAVSEHGMWLYSVTLRQKIVGFLKTVFGFFVGERRKQLWTLRDAWCSLYLRELTCGRIINKL
jgi:hypothetical protein